MKSERGIAGSTEPEATGVHLAKTLEDAWWFASFGQVSPVDVWAVDVTGLAVEEDAGGDLFYSGEISADRLVIEEAGLEADEAAKRLRLDELSRRVEGVLTFRVTGAERGDQDA